MLKGLGGFKCVSKIYDQHALWTVIYLLKSKSDAFSTFQSFPQYKVIPSGFYIERLRADKGVEYINKDFKGHFLQDGVPPK